MVPKSSLEVIPKSRRAKLAPLIVVSSLLIVTVLFYSASEESYAIANNPLNQKRNYLTQDCKAEWFPPRHWTLRQSTHSPPVNATYVSEVHMFGTLEAQHAIWNHQHPSSCNDKKFLLYEAVGEDHGIGSVIHVTGVALQAALNLNRILVLYPQPAYEWTNGRYCEGMDTIDECYFEPLSSCTIFDALGCTNLSSESLRKFPELNVDTYTQNSDRVLRTAVLQVGSGVIPTLYRETPAMFHGLLKSGGIHKNFYYWWRAQSAAYIVRPTLRTLRELDRRRSAVFQGQQIAPGTVSVHVRHGDKWKEAHLENDTMFLRTAEALVARDARRLQRTLFLSTEDPLTVRFFSNLTMWRVSYTNVTRDAYKDNPLLGPEGFAAQIGWDEEFLNSLLSLQLALECDGFVGAISSNWNRLIDELRSTVRCKHDRLYVDVVQGFKVTDFNW